MIISRTPLRLSFLGGGTDFPCWSSQHGGIVISTTIDKYVYVTVRRLPPYHDFKNRIVYSKIEELEDGVLPEHPAVAAALHFFGDCTKWGYRIGDFGGVEIFHQADLPGRSGTGSSSSFLVGLLKSLSTLGGSYLSPAELTRTACRLEQTEMGEVVGCQDQTAAAYGGLNLIHFRKSGEIDVRPLPLLQQRIESLEKHTLLFFTKVQRTSSQVASGYAPKLGDREYQDQQFAQLRLAEEGVGCVLEGRWQALGGLIDRSWRIKARLPGVASPEILGWYEKARLAGSWGGKLMGAGGGGMMFLLAPPENHENIKKAMQAEGLLHVPVKFSEGGSEVVFADRKTVGNISG